MKLAVQTASSHFPVGFTIVLIGDHKHKHFLQAWTVCVQVFHDSVTGLSFSESGDELAAACEDRVLRVISIKDLHAKHFNFKRKELLRDLVDVAFGAGDDLFVLTKVSLERIRIL